MKVAAGVPAGRRKETAGGGAGRYKGGGQRRFRLVTSYDMVVIGGGHAGAEAAWAGANLGARVGLITLSAEAIGRMSCNPAIGGLGKGQMVREIDALGGLMGLVTDATGIQFRMLNQSKGPAVRAPRAQADRALYAAELRRRLEAHPNIAIVEGCAADILTRDEYDNGVMRPAVCGVALEDGRLLQTRAALITAGTFMRGLMHCGPTQTPGGRVGEPAAVGISRCLLGLGFELGRLKTGTPPRVHRDSVDFGVLEEQPGDPVPTPFSFMNDRLDQPQVSCWITYTNERTHELIRANLHVAPMYSGQIQSRGPRYCPSIEDKVVRFADKSRHQLFLEPEGRESERIYCNGISTSLPAEVQKELLKTIPGLIEARMLQPGYAVEYDFVPTHQTQASLETKRVRRLFVAGQVNGTSGYEEAAGQGLLAGLNAARLLDGRPPVVPARDQAYLGVMLDDLVTRPPTEPYRMFTSRAEYRLHLRSDNADQRLTPLGREWGLVDDARWERYVAKMEAIRRIQTLCAGRAYEGGRLSDWLRRPEVGVEDVRRILEADSTGWKAGPTTESADLAGRKAGPTTESADLTGRKAGPTTELADLAGWKAGPTTELADLTGRKAGPPAGFPVAVLQQVLTEAKYAGYLARQQRQIERFRNLEALPIPPDLNYAAIRELRAEAREKFSAVGPRTLGQAGRISGISPADITTLWIYLTVRQRRAGACLA
ncbi:MAG: tRNA uridine-5-carboxymethylaminomethyl(34) synthesis enzyme MnmG [Planctomycetota bacterium]